jgi:hypothetical protein
MSPTTRGAIWLAQDSPFFAGGTGFAGLDYTELT